MLASAAVVSGAVFCLSGCSDDGRPSGGSPVVGDTVVYASASGGVSADRLAPMRWEDIAPTLEATLRHGLSAEVLQISAGVEAFPCRYLRGMIEMANSRPAQALAEWEKIPLDEIPVDALYAPWRLAGDFPGVNRYDAALVSAVRSGKTSPLVSARWHALVGDYLPALEAYLKSDPAQWTPHEVEQFRVMKLHSPVAPDVDRILAGALQGQRVPVSLRADLARIIKHKPVPESKKVAELLKKDPSFSAAAIQAASQQLDLRQAFAANRFSEVVEMTRPLDPSRASNEAVLLAFLAASKTGERQTANRWAEEWLRRNPGKETEIWIANIQANSR